MTPGRCRRVTDDDGFLGVERITGVDVRVGRRERHVGEFVRQPARRTEAERLRVRVQFEHGADVGVEHLGEPSGGLVEKRLFRRDFEGVATEFGDRLLLAGTSQRLGLGLLSRRDVPEQADEVPITADGEVVERDAERDLVAVGVLARKLDVRPVEVAGAGVEIPAERGQMGVAEAGRDDLEFASTDQFVR